MKKSYLFSQVYFLIFAMFFATSCNGQTNSNAENSTKSIDKTKIDKIDEIIRLYSENAGFNGSVLVAHNGKVIYKNGFGLANMEWNIPNEVNTKFRIASVTKPFTAMLVMQLVAKNKLDLQKPITTYLKDYPKENGSKITIHHLLTHSSGLKRDVETEQKQFHNPKQLVEMLDNKPLIHKPGEKFEYSNAGYILLGYILETVTKKSYKDLLEENIFKPLNMNNSGFYRHRLLLENRSSGYRNNFIDYQNSNYRDFSNAYSAGAIYSTVEDMFLFDQAMYSENLLPKKYMDLILTKYIQADFGGHYGYGLELAKKPIGNSSDMIETIGHSGTLPGYCAVYTRIPSSHSAIIFLSNTGRAYLNTMTTAITGILYDKPYDKPKKSIAKVFIDTIDKKGIDSGIQFFNKFKNNDDYYVKEKEMNIVSYKLLQSDRVQEAREVLKLAIGVFPNAFNLYDSYGEVLLVLGEKEKAIENYRKSVELNPKNKNGIRILKELEY
ncbi:CubicO group peptidase (beta-lactamase class C family) [Lutibacter oceani]|uniref:CubicO group peptidase (Beta-lactamase class C family) n=1 Tax=Lutibacter oceani TaxID=1853311 RepID=A0A3D9S5A8_9FLAO|nr:serine hydrolase [Lutibacter oceani]REE84466.1 CubicO group peptidase (beta-lactamase class C family) [Lutibacter oceani]